MKVEVFSTEELALTRAKQVHETPWCEAYVGPITGGYLHLYMGQNEYCDVLVSNPGSDTSREGDGHCGAQSQTPIVEFGVLLMGFYDKFPWPPGSPV